MQKINEYKIYLSEKQSLAKKYLEDEGISEVLYGGAKGGGKTVFLAVYALLYAQLVKLLCSLTVVQYPPVIGFLGRKRAVDFNDTTLETWKRIIPSTCYEIRVQDKEIVMFGGVCKYQFGGLDDEATVKKFNSAEYGLIAIDQAEEMIRDDAAMLRGTQGRAKLNNIFLPKKALFTANPGECFLKQDFGLDGDSICPDFRKYVQALPSDNEFIDSKSYVKQLNEAWKHHPDILRAYVEGDWSSTAEGGFLIDRDTCQRLTKLELPQKMRPKYWASCDPAWLGDKTDEIVVYVFSDNKVIDQKYMYNQETTTTASELVKLVRQYKGTLIGIDSIGVGAGVVSDCRALVGNDIDIVAVNSARSPEMSDSEKGKKIPDQSATQFLNIRAQMYWKAVEELKNNKWTLPKDDELIRQLCSIKYEIRNGKIKIEDKKDIKKRLGKSPDRADCFVMGIWLSNQVRHKERFENKQFPSTARMLQKTKERRWN